MSLRTGILMQAGKIKLLSAGYTKILYAMGSTINEYFYSVGLQCIS